MEWYETANALGGTAVLGEDVTSGPAFVERIERGLPRRTVAQLKRFGHLSDADLSNVIPRRTLTSLKRAARLTPEQSDRIARTASVVACTVAGVTSLGLSRAVPIRRSELIPRSRSWA
jgi:uncharacterized protein (DUF2384 family)